MKDNQLSKPFKKKSKKKDYLGKVAFLSHLAEISYDRTEDGSVDYERGMKFSNSKLLRMGFYSPVRIQSSRPPVSAMVLYNDKVKVIVFRGTYNDAGWEQNFKFDKVKTKKGEFHQGWHECVSTLFKDLLEIITNDPLYRNKKLYVVGHSKGAAEAQQFATLVNDIIPVEMCVGVACPRPFSTKTAKDITKEFNKGCKKWEWRMVWVQNNNDMVTKVPLKMMNANQAGKRLYISAGSFNKPGDVHTNINPFHEFFDSVIMGRLLARTRFFKYDSIEDHHPCYYVNALYKAAGVNTRIQRWPD